MDRRNAILKSLVAVLLVFCLAGASGCGKKAMPSARSKTRTFTWQDMNATAVEKCINFKGTLAGAFENLDGIQLELDPVNGPEDCPGCPFNPSQKVSFSPAKAGFNAQTGTVDFSYCPAPAKAYRWRVIGQNIYDAAKAATTVDKLLPMP